MTARELRGEHGPELRHLPVGEALRVQQGALRAIGDELGDLPPGAHTKPKRHLHPVADVFKADPPPSRARRAWELTADIAVMCAALAIAGWLDWREHRRARRWQP